MQDALRSNYFHLKIIATAYCRNSAAMVQWYLTIALHFHFIKQQIPLHPQLSDVTANMLYLAFKISFICLSIHFLFQPGFIFYRAGNYIRHLIWTLVFVICTGHLQYMASRERADKWTDKAVKPLFDCLICMSSVWTWIIGCNYYHMSSVWTWIITTLMVCGFNVIWDSFIYYLRRN